MQKLINKKFFKAYSFLALLGMAFFSFALNAFAVSLSPVLDGNNNPVTLTLQQGVTYSYPTDSARCIQGDDNLYGATEVPGISFNYVSAGLRTITGTPTTAGSYTMHWFCGGIYTTINVTVTAPPPPPPPSGNFATRMGGVGATTAGTIGGILGEGLRIILSVLAGMIGMWLLIMYVKRLVGGKGLTKGEQKVKNFLDN